MTRRFSKSKDEVFFVGQVSHVGCAQMFFNTLMKQFLNLESETSKLALLYGPFSCTTIPAAVTSFVKVVGSMKLLTGTTPALGGIISYPEPQQIAGVEFLPIDLHRIAADKEIIDEARENVKLLRSSIISFQVCLNLVRDLMWPRDLVIQYE